MKRRLKAWKKVSGLLFYEKIVRMRYTICFRKTEMRLENW